MTVPVGPVLDRRSRRLPVSLLVALGLVAIAFAVGLHVGGAPSGETAAVVATSPQPTPSAGASTASTSSPVASGAPFASPPLWSDYVRTFDATRVIEALPGGATCVGGSPGSWIAPRTGFDPDETLVKTWLTSCPMALDQQDAFLSRVVGAIAPVDNPIRDGAGGVMAVTPYEEGGFVGSVVSGSHKVPIDRPASLRPSHAAHSNPNASMATYPWVFVHCRVSTALWVGVADHCWPTGTTCRVDPSSSAKSIVRAEMWRSAR